MINAGLSIFSFLPFLSFLPVFNPCFGFLTVFDGLNQFLTPSCKKKKTGLWHQEPNHELNYSKFYIDEMYCIFSVFISQL